MKSLRIIGLSTCLFLVTGIFGQQDTKPSTNENSQSPTKMRGDESSGHPEKTTSYFTAGLSYVNDNVYLGRKDSSAVQYFTPQLGYHARSGFFAEGSLGFLASSDENRVDMGSIAAGYEFTAGNYHGQLTASKYFYSSQSTNIKSELKGGLEYSNSYDFGFIQPTLTTTVNVSSKIDFAGALGLEHSFTLISDMLDLTPTVVANAATQNYYDSYYKKRRFNPKRKGKGLPAGIASISGQVLGASAFKVLDYEASLPLNFERGKFSFAIAPTYAIPVHPAEVVITTKSNNGNSNTVTNSEKLSNTLYVTMEIGFKF